MSVITAATKGKVGLKAAKAAAKHPGLLAKGVQASRPVGTLGLKVSKPILKRRARKRIGQLDGLAHRLGETLAVYGPRAAYELGLAEPPKPRRTAPCVAAGIVIGAIAVFLLDPEQGGERRHKVAELVS